MKLSTFTWQRILPFKWYLLGPLLSMLVFAFSISFKPYLLKKLINVMVAAPSSGEALAGLWHYAHFYIAILFTVPLCWRLYDWCCLKYEPALKNQVAATLTEQLGKHSHSYFQDNFAGNLASKVNDAASRLPNIIAIIINRFIGNSLMLLIAITMLWLVHPWFGLAILGWAVLFVGYAVLILKKFNFLATVTAEAAAKIMGNIVDYLGNISSVRFFGAKKTESEKLAILQKDYLIAAQRRRWFILKVYSVQGILFSLYQTLCLVLLIYLYTKNQVTAGDFALILALNMHVIDNLWEMSNEIRTFSEDVGTVSQALKVIYAPIQIRDIKEAKPLTIQQGKIAFEHVRFNYGVAGSLFNDKSVIIEAGEKVGLVGYSGSGKSSFVNLILRLFDVAQGRILIDDQDISQVTQQSLHAAIGIIPQDPTLFHRTLAENIGYGRHDASTAEIITAAKAAHSHDFILELSQGYDSLVGERGVKLSGGQRQRIAIARAFLKNAPILILDEATSQLDSVSEGFIQDSLWRLMQGKTTLVIAHRLSTLLKMDRILVFDRGAIVQQGSHQQLLAQEGLYKTLWSAQVGGFILDME